MAGFSAVWRRWVFRSCSNYYAARACSEKIKFTVWAQTSRSPRSATMIAKRTFPTLMLGHVADAASLRGCGTHVAACSQSRKIGHLKPRRATNFKPCFRRRRFQRFSRGTRQSLSLSTFRITDHPPLQPAQVDPALRESGGGSKRPTGPAPPQPTTSACSLVPRHRCDHQAKHR